MNLREIIKKGVEQSWNEEQWFYAVSQFIDECIVFNTDQVKQDIREALDRCPFTGYGKRKL